MTHDANTTCRYAVLHFKSIMLSVVMLCHGVDAWSILVS